MMPAALDGAVVLVILLAAGLVIAAFWMRYRERRRSARAQRRRHSKVRKLRNVGVVALLMGGALGGCATDVVMMNPRTGETATCPAPAFNPWSQQQACIGDRTAQGWRRVDPR